MKEKIAKWWLHISVILGVIQFNLFSILRGVISQEFVHNLGKSATFAYSWYYLGLAIFLSAFVASIFNFKHWKGWYKLYPIITLVASVIAGLFLFIVGGIALALRFGGGI